MGVWETETLAGNSCIFRGTGWDGEGISYKEKWEGVHTDLSKNTQKGKSANTA